MLHRGHVPGPYVLAGHSFGGLYTLTFAARYPDEIAGMVLVDSTAPASKPRATPRSDGSSYNLTGRVSALISTSARLGLGRLAGVPASHLRSTIDEYIRANSSSRAAATLVDFADKPLIVLTAGIGSNAAWMTAQDHLATLSSNNAHRVIEAIHAALIADEQGAAATTQAILDVVSSIRTDEPVG